MQVSVIQNHMVETENKGFHAILTPVVINMYTQVLLRRNPGFPIFLLLGLPNFVSTTLSSRKTSDTQETANNFSNKSQARGWLWPWRPGRTEPTFAGYAAASAWSPGKENVQKAPCHPPGNRGEFHSSVISSLFIIFSLSSSCRSVSALRKRRWQNGEMHAQKW